MSVQFKLKADPTFDAKVPVPMPGRNVPYDVLMTFRHRTKQQLAEFVAARADKDDVESVMDMVTGWSLPEPFDAENVELLLEHYIGAALAIYNTYVTELTGARRKNS